MAETNGPNYCEQCGNPIQSGDRFCGVCGAPAAPVTPENPQVIPQQVAAQTSPSPRSRTFLVTGVVVLLLVLFTGGGAIAMFATGGNLFGEADPEPLPPADTQEAAPAPDTTQETTRVSETTSSSPTSERDQYEEFAREYDEASRDEDWEATYSMLYETSQTGVTDSQDEFTEDEWIEIHEALREENGEPAPLDWVTVDQNDEATDSPARVTLYYEDDTQETITVIIPMAVASDDESGPQRFLTEEEVASLEDVASDTSSSGDPEEAVEETLRGHYEAIGDGDFVEAYSYFGPTFRSANSEESWIDEEESQGITDSTVHSVEVTSISDSTAQANVDVSFEDNSGSPNFLLEWSLVQEDGEWKLDELLEGEQISSESEETSPGQTIPNFSELFPEDTNGGGV